jgi:hypothetical protein
MNQRGRKGLEKRTRRKRGRRKRGRKREWGRRKRGMEVRARRKSNSLPHLPGNKPRISSSLTASAARTVFPNPAMPCTSTHLKYGAA